MSALFPRWTNTFSRLMGLSLLASPLAAVGGLMLYVRSPYSTGQFNPVEQPVQFDHRHHVADEGIDCRYCHFSVETASSAGLPSTATCMNCHAQIWNKSPLLEPVREAYFSRRPIPWVRVHDLPGFVYFDHSIHVAKGVGCVTCHGRVDQMAHIEQAQPLTMSWCLDCHFDPTPFLRPKDQVTSMTWQPEGDPVALGQRLLIENQVRTRVSCTTCHR